MRAIQNTLLFCSIITLALPNAELISCSKCVSDYIVVQWERVYVSKTIGGDDVEGDKNCLNPSHSHPTVRCNGNCALLKVIGEKDGVEYDFGVMRDCSQSRGFKLLMKKVNETAPSVMLPLPSVGTAPHVYRRTAVFHICNKHLCNSGRRHLYEEMSSLVQANDGSTFRNLFISFIFTIKHVF